VRRSARASLLAMVSLSVVLLALESIEAADFRVAQADAGDRMGPVRSPNVVIEEPRPPCAVIETEGRTQRDNCRSVIVRERQDGLEVTRTERRCEH
jgi:hypothetical protein